MGQLVVGGIPVPTTPARALGVQFTPNVNRPVLCIYSVRINNAAGGTGRAEIVSDAANPPITVRCRVGTGAVGAGVHEAVLVYLVPAAHNVIIQAVDEIGVNAYAITAQTEIVL